MSEPLSKRNSEVARLRALVRQRSARRDAGRFVIEGAKLVAEALASDLVVLDVFVDADFQPSGELLAGLAAAELEPRRLGPGGIERIASTTTPQPIVAELELPVSDWSLLAAADVGRALVVVDVNDPGNVGTLTRSAAAADFDLVVALGSSVDPFGPKATRASAGATFGVAIVIDDDVSGGLERLASRGLERLGTRMLDAEPCDRVDLRGPLALVLGSEAHGLGAEPSRHIDRWVSVPMPGPVESLNVAMAGTILTYEVARQRRASA